MSIQGDQETRDERYARQTKESFAALGQFVQDFEIMIMMLRFACVDVVPVADQRFKQLLQLIMNHQVMTAKPLFEIFRGMCATLLADDEVREPRGIDASDLDAFNGVLQQVHKSFNELVEQRNAMLHGTWHIGFANAQQDDFSAIDVVKFAVAKSGLKRKEGLPASSADLQKLSLGCQILWRYIQQTSLALRTGDQMMRMSDVFQHEVGTGEWVCKAIIETARNEIQRRPV